MARVPKGVLIGAVATILVGGAIVAGVTANNGGGQPIVVRHQAGTSGGSSNTILPDLVGKDPVTGASVSLAAFRGKPLFINLWASWCPGCNVEAPDIARFTKDHPEVGFVEVDEQDTTGAAKSFVAKYRWQHTSLFDPDGSMGAQLGLQGLPTTIAVDANGRIVGQVAGIVSYESLTAAAKELTGAQ